MEVDEPRNYDDQRGDVFPAAQPFEDYAKYSHDGEQEEQANGVEANEHIDPEMNGKFDAGTTSTQPNGGPQQSTPPSGQQEAAQEEKSIDPKEILEPYAWDDLEERFLRMMEECQRREEEIEKEFAEWCLVFKAWASTTREYEKERAHKRLKTRMAWVNNSEHSLEEKRRHYIKVVQAFESALALLAGP